MKGLQLARSSLRRSNHTRSHGFRRSASYAAPLRRRFSTKITNQSETPAATVATASLLDPTATALLTTEDIFEILPHRYEKRSNFEVEFHRYPFLLVDRVTQMEKAKMIVGVKNVTINDNFFIGHFPGRPIMPGIRTSNFIVKRIEGVLQIEALAQLLGILILKDVDKSAQENFFFGGVENCRFKKPVVPGDTLVTFLALSKEIDVLCRCCKRRSRN